MSNTSTRAALRPMAVAAALLLGLGAAGCSNRETTLPYQPAAGVNTTTTGAQVRGLMFISDGSTLRLAGTVATNTASDSDQLKQISGYALNQDGTQGKALTVNSKALTLTPGNPVKLYPANITATGDVKAGGMTSLTLTFAKASPVQIQVPVVDAKAVDISTQS